MKTKILVTAFLLFSLITGIASCGSTSTSTTTSTTSTTTSISSTTSTTTTSSSNGYDFEVYNPDGYYDDALYATGQELKSALRTITSTDHRQTTYDEIRFLYKNSDADPEIEGNIILFYSRCSVSGTWDSGSTYNREHIWPKSMGGFGTSSAGADLHHIRPTDPRVNEIRGNKPYGEVGENFTTVNYNYKGTNVPAGYSSGDCFEPLDEVKGDVARIIMYLIVRYSDLENRFSQRSTTPIKNCSYETLLEWNELDPVDDLERHRNEYVYSVQNNRNPFIDNPEFANLIWN